MSFIFCPICDQRHRISSDKGAKHLEFSEIFAKIFNKIESGDDEQSIKDTKILFMSCFAKTLGVIKNSGVPEFIINFVKRLYISNQLQFYLMEDFLNLEENKDLGINDIACFSSIFNAMDEEINRFCSFIYDYDNEITLEEYDNCSLDIEFGFSDNYDFIVDVGFKYDRKYMNGNNKNVYINIPTYAKLTLNLIHVNEEDKNRALQTWEILDLTSFSKEDMFKILDKCDELTKA